jgi:hypothetical protein
MKDKELLSILESLPTDRLSSILKDQTINKTDLVNVGNLLFLKLNTSMTKDHMIDKIVTSISNDRGYEIIRHGK